MLLTIFQIFQTCLVIISIFLFFFSSNVGQDPNLKVISLFVLGTLGLALLTWSFFRYLLNLKDRHLTNNLTSVFILMFFSFDLFPFGSVNDLVNFDYAENFIWAFVTTTILLFISRIKNQKEVHQFVIIWCGCILVYSSYLIFDFYSARSSVSQLTTSQKVDDGSYRPNVFYIILDSYPRNDVLVKDFNFDNSKFTNKLEAQGFKFLDESYSNYPATYLSLSSTLQQSYVLQPGENVVSDDRSKYYDILRGNNKTVREFKSLGYRYVHFENPFWEGSKCGSQVDRCLSMRWELTDLFETETALIMFSKTPIEFLVFKVMEEKVWPQVRFLNHHFKKNFFRKKNEFFFAHVVSPHFPHIYDKNCEPLPHSKLQWDNHDNFFNELRCLNADVEELITTIIQIYPDSYIILQSDHGVGFKSKALINPIEDISISDVHQQFGILNAFKIPDACKSTLKSDLTPVNNFKEILNCLQGGKKAHLSDRHIIAYYKSNKKLFGKAVEVTNFLRAADGTLNTKLSEHTK